MQQTFTVGKEPKVIIDQAGGDLEVRGWDRREIEIVIDDHVSDLHQEGDALVIFGSHDDIELRAPFDTDIRVTGLSGDVSIRDVRRVELKDIIGDVELEDIGAGADLENIGEAIALTNIAADLQVTNASTLRSRAGIGGDASLKNVALVELEAAGADLSVEQVETAVIGKVGGDLDVVGVSNALSCGNVGGDCEVQDSADAEITMGSIGGDFEIPGAASVQIGSAGGDCDLHNVQGNVEVGNVGGDADFSGIGGNLQLGRVGGDAELLALAGTIEVGSIGGDLELQAAFPADSTTRLNVGGDANIVLPDNPNLSIRAAVGGEVRGQSVAMGGRGNLVSLVYGNGERGTHLELSVGGDLELSGAGSPRSSSTSGSWGDFGSEMAELGREMGRLGQELSREIASAFSEVGWSKGANWGDEISRKVDERVRRAQRRAEEHARKAEEKARQANERASRVRVRFNSREWQLDPERLERLKDQARKAATEGVSGALEAVERAVSNLRVPTPPKPPMPPSPPAGPSVAPMPLMPQPPVPPTPPMPGQINRTGIQSETAPGTGGAPEPSLEQEREAILRMIAEGRISPEEGDLLLEGLGG